MASILQIETSKRNGFKKGNIPWNKGIKLPEKYRKKCNPPIFTGEKSSNWQGGKTFKKDYRKNYWKLWSSKNKDKIRLNRKKYKILKRKSGTLTTKTIQRVYEENIKIFGTLTCSYCINKIIFGNDTIEHIIPLSRGGNHDYDNLIICCKSCNSSKKDKLYEEVI